MIPKSENRFPACAKPRKSRFLPFDASAGEARSDKIMFKQKAKAKSKFDFDSVRFSFMVSPCGAECAPYLAAADRRVRQLRVGHGA